MKSLLLGLILGIGAVVSMASSRRSLVRPGVVGVHLVSQISMPTRSWTTRRGSQWAIVPSAMPSSRKRSSFLASRPVQVSMARCWAGSR